MTCYHPIPAWRDPRGGVVFSDKGGDRCDVPCGKCLGCRTRRAQDWSVRCFHESQLYERNCFITLTYGRNAVPPGGSLDHRDYQLFTKRMVHHMGPVRFFMCGEYGPLNQRPHYHAIIFGHYFPDRVPAGVSKSGQTYYKSKLLEDLWTHGQCSVQDVNLKSIAYCTRYILDKVSSDSDDSLYSSIDADGVIVPRRPEYSACSNNPGIGARWFELFRSDVFGHDYVVVDGSKFCVPRYYDKLEARLSGKDVFEEEYKFARVELGRSKYADNTEDRLRVREHVHSARVSTLKRDSV